MRRTVAGRWRRVGDRGGRVKEGKGEKKNWKSKEEAKAEGGVEEGRAGARKREEETGREKKRGSETPLAAPASLCFSPPCWTRIHKLPPLSLAPFPSSDPLPALSTTSPFRTFPTPFSPARVPPSHPISLMDLRHFLTWTCLVYAMKVHF